MKLKKRKYKEYNGKEISLRNDDVFKIALGKNENVHLLKDFLQAILKREITNIVVKTEVTLDKTVKNSKECRLDLLAEIDNKEQINVEIQNSNKYNTVSRSLYYGSTLYRNSLKEGEDYNKAKRTVVIMILDYNEFKDVTYHEVARMKRDYNNEIITDKVEYHYIQLPKFIETVKEIKTDEEMWIAYISNQLDKEEKGELIRMKKSIEEINAIVDEVMNDKDVYDALTIRELNEYDRKAALSYAKEKGEAEGRAKGMVEGRAKGMAEGMAEGERKTKIEMAKLMLKDNKDVEEIKKYTGLTEEELENIDNLE